MKESIDKISDKILFACLIALLVFLPFSSWLVSLTGNIWWSLLRDILVIIIFICAIWRISKKNIKFLMPVLLMILFALLSFFWKETGTVQWLRGFRYAIIPIVLMGSLAMARFDSKKVKTVIWVIFMGVVVIMIITVLEFFGIRVPLTMGSSGVGSLGSNQVVGGIAIHRLQSILAGPNALGLYFLAIITYSLTVFRRLNNKFIYLLPLVTICLVYTFSRSVLIGAISVFVLALTWFLSQKVGVLKAIIIDFVLLILIFVSCYWVYQNPKTKDYVIHYASSSMRVEQYQRIWDSRGEIGLLGRGLGASGLSSQYNLDGSGGENKWTENVYLDLFEQLGLIGLVLFLFMYSWLVKEALAKRDSMLSRNALYLLVGFGVSGLFINTYTGQVGIYLFYLANGLMLNGLINGKVGNEAKKI